MSLQRFLLFIGATLACALHSRNGTHKGPPDAPKHLHCAKQGTVLEDPGEFTGSDFSGAWLYTDYSGDVQGLYREIGVPPMLRHIPPLYDYGRNMIRDRVTQNGNVIVIATAMHFPGLPPIYGKESYTIGVERQTEYGFRLCGNWIDNHRVIVMDSKIRQNPNDVKITLPRSYRMIDGDATILMAERNGVVASMRYTRKRNVNRNLNQDDGREGRDNLPLAIRAEHREIMAQLMAMGALPPFIPMRIINKSAHET